MTTYPLVYQYKPRDLYIAYGIAVLVTLIAALFGLHAVWMNGASYSSKFSTSIRIAKSTGLDRLLDDEDDGCDPLPKGLKKARLQVSGGKRLLAEPMAGNESGS